MMLIAWILHFIRDNYADKFMSNIGEVSKYYYRFIFLFLS